MNEALKDLIPHTSAADVADALSDLTSDSSRMVMHPLTAVNPDKVIFGQAVTLRSLPVRADLVKKIKQDYSDKPGGGDPLMYAFSLCGPDNVLVIDASGYHGSALGGGTKFNVLEVRGAAGVVADGALRDREEFEKFNMATYCNGFTPQAGTGISLYPAMVNEPIMCAGALVRAGDYILGDQNGITVIPEELAEDALNLGVVQNKFHAYLTKLIKERKILLSDIDFSSPEFNKGLNKFSDFTEKQSELAQKYLGLGPVK